MGHFHRLTAPWLVACAATLCAGPPAGAVNLILNGGFETNGGPNSNTFSNWTVVEQPTDSGNWWAQTGNMAPINAFTVPVPPQGSFAAMSDGSGPGSQALLQTFTVPAGAASVTLSFSYFRNNLAADYFTPGSLDFGVIPNQQARVDILTAGAGPFDLGGSVLQNVFQTMPGDLTMDNAYNTFSQNVTSILGGGGTFQLRFAEVDNQAQFEFGVDNVVLDFETPEPGTLWLLAGGLAALGVVRQLASVRGGR